MVHRFSITSLVMMLVTAILVVSCIIFCLLVISNARESVEEEMESTYALIQQLILKQEDDHPAVNPQIYASELASALSAVRHIHVRFDVPQRGFPPSTHSAPKHNVRDSDVPAWFIYLLSPDESEASPPIVLQTIHPVGQLTIFPDPLDEVEEIWEESLPIVLAMFGICIALWFGIYTALRWSLSPLKQLTTSLAKLEAGELDTRLQQDKATVELGQLVVAFNQLASHLENARSANQILCKRLLDVQEELCRSVASELHDEMAPYLFRIQVELLQLKSAGEAYSDEVIAAQIANLQQLTSQLQQRVRNTLKLLRPKELDDLPFDQAIENLVEIWRSRYPNTQWDICVDIGDVSLDETVKVTLYRVTQECLTNTVRHAKASAVHTRISQFNAANNAGISLHFTNDGCKSNKINKGFGLLGMQERITALGGKLTYALQPESEQFELHAVLPIHLNH